MKGREYAMDGAIRRGLRAGAFAGLLLVGIFFIDYGPANNLTAIARWFALDENGWSKVIGAILLVALGTLFGGLFGLVFRRSRTLLQSILGGLATGLCWWVVLVLLLSIVVRHMPQSTYGLLFWFIMSLLYGLALGSLYRQA